MSTQQSNNPQVVGVEKPFMAAQLLSMVIVNKLPRARSVRVIMAQTEYDEASLRVEWREPDEEGSVSYIEVLLWADHYDIDFEALEEDAAMADYYAALLYHPEDAFWSITDGSHVDSWWGDAVSSAVLAVQ